MISIASPLLGFEEEAAIHRVLLSGQLVQGEKVAAFEQGFAQMCQVDEAVAVSSGTAALHLALLAHGIGPGDEVITTAFSFAATANVILLVGATPVFVDIEPDTYTLDPTLVEAAITSAQLLQDALQERGAIVYVDDPLFSDRELRALGYTPFTSENESEMRAIIVQTGHRIYQEYDFTRFPNCRVVLDGRRALDRERVEACGIRYVAIGDGRSAQTQRASDQEAPVLAERGGQRACD